MARPISVVEVTPGEKQELERRVRASTTSGRDCLRARIVLMRSEGVRQQEVATRLGVSAPSVNKWSQRYDREGLNGLRDKPGRGTKPSIPLATVRRVIEEAGQSPLEQRGDSSSWTTLRRILEGQQLVTVTFRRSDGRSTYARPRGQNLIRRPTPWASIPLPEGSAR